MTTALARRLGIRLPLVLAPMAGETASAALVAEVSAAGGLGSLGAAYFTPDAIRTACREIRDRTEAPFAVNLFAPLEPEPVDAAVAARYRARLAEFHAAAGLPEPPETAPAGPVFAEQLDAALDGGAPVISTTFGLFPADVMARLKAGGVFTIGTATSPEEARAVEAAGFDAVMAQGYEAGGHRGGFTGAHGEGALVGTLALVPQVVDAVAIPVIAAGGISDGRGLAAALLLGAEAAALGTAFLQAAECPLNAGGKAALAGAGAEATTLTRAFSGRMARGLRNSVTEAFAAEDIPAFPLPNGLTRPLRAHAAKTQNADLTSVWAGQAAALGRAEPAADIVARVMDEAREALRRAPAL